MTERRNWPRSSEWPFFLTLTNAVNASRKKKTLNGAELDGIVLNMEWIGMEWNGMDWIGMEWRILSIKSQIPSYTTQKIK